MALPQQIRNQVGQFANVLKFHRAAILSRSTNLKEALQMESGKRVMAAVARFLSDPAAWWEQRKYTITLCVIVVTLLHVFISVGIIDLRSWLVWLAVWAQRLVFPFSF